MVTEREMFVPISNACRRWKTICSLAGAGAVALALTGDPAAADPGGHDATPALAGNATGGMAAGQPLQSAQGAGDAPAGRANDGIVSELRLGAMYHDAGVFGRNKEDDVIDLNAEILFGSPRFLRFIWSPRPHLGVTYAPGDHTTSQVYFGLTWQYAFWRGAFVEGSLGGSVNDGSKEGSADEKALGCHLLFRESVSLGYTFDERHSLMVTLDHISNARLCDYNEGLDTVGVRYGFRF
jgi:lipid A 3-O-deacylase